MKRNQGFTLIELMIVVAIIGILAAVALPAYQTYTKKSRFSEVVLAASAVKTAVDTCFQTRGVGLIANCDSDVKTGADLIGAAAGTHVATVAITAGTAIITATGESGSFGGTETYILTPTVANGSLTWAATGTCIASGLC